VVAVGGHRTERYGDDDDDDIDDDFNWESLIANDNSELACAV